MKCSKQDIIIELVDLYLSNDLSEEQTGFIRTHILTCDSCKKIFEQECKLSMVYKLGEKDKIKFSSDFNSKILGRIKKNTSTTVLENQAETETKISTREEYGKSFDLPRFLFKLKSKIKEKRIQYIFASAAVVLLVIFLNMYDFSKKNTVNIGSKVLKSTSIAHGNSEKKKQTIIFLKKQTGNIVKYLHKKEKWISTEKPVEKLCRGEKISVKKSGKGILEYKNGSKIALSQDTSVEVYEDSIQLNHGKVWLKIKKSSKQYKVKTPVAIIGVLGTNFMVSHDDKKGTKVFVKSGTVSVSNQKKQIILNSGQYVNNVTKLGKFIVKSVKKIETKEIKQSGIVEKQIVKVEEVPESNERTIEVSAKEIVENVDLTTPSLKSLMIGDVNEDGKINGKGIGLVKKYTAKTVQFSENQKLLADVDQNGKIDHQDLFLYQLYISGVGDIDNNGRINNKDYVLLSSYLGSKPYMTRYDINHDGKFDWADIKSMKTLSENTGNSNKIGKEIALKPQNTGNSSGPGTGSAPKNVGWIVNNPTSTVNTPAATGTRNTSTNSKWIVSNPANTTSTVNTPTGTTVPVSTVTGNQKVISLTLIDADKNVPISLYDPIPASVTIDIGTLPTRNLSIRANTNPSRVGKVIFFLDGKKFRTESSAPYALAGDANGVYRIWNPTVGKITVEAIPFAAASVGGSQGKSCRISINFVSKTAVPGNYVFVEKNGLVSMEAENFSKNNGYKFESSKSLHTGKRKADFSGYSGKGYMATNGIGKKMDYFIDFSTTGKYYVILRSWADIEKFGGSFQNGFCAEFDGKPLVSAQRGCGINVAKRARWEWFAREQFKTQPLLRGRVTLQVNSPGRFCFSILPREKTSWLDKIVLQHSSLSGSNDYTGGVSGSGPLESIRITGPIKSGVSLISSSGQTKSYIAHDDGDLKKGIALPSPRFKDNGDGTATDKLTKLVWLKNANSAGAMNWKNAVTWCKNLSSGQFGLKDGSTAGSWRLPNINEFQSLFDYGKHHPALTSGHPFIGIQSTNYWSSTTCASSSGRGCPVSVWTGATGWYSKGTSDYVWAIRGNSAGKAMVFSTGQTKSYLSYDDGALKKGVALPNPRFKNNGDGTVTDNLTKLIWLRNANCIGTKDWKSAVNWCKNLSNGQFGLSDGSNAGAWRLPNIREFQSLFDFAQHQPALASGNPFTGIQSTNYWSSTTFASSSGRGWTVGVSTGAVGWYSKGTSDYVWAVRDGNTSTVIQPPPPVSAPAITSFTLIDANNDMPVTGFDPIPPNAVINLANLTTNSFSIRANAKKLQTVASVVFIFDGVEIRTESSSPYAAWGDINGNYISGRITRGIHKITGIPYSKKKKNGQKGPAKSLSFKIININNTPVPPTPVLPTPVPPTPVPPSGGIPAGGPVPSGSHLLYRIPSWKSDYARPGLSCSFAYPRFGSGQQATRPIFNFYNKSRSRYYNDGLHNFTPATLKWDANLAAIAQKYAEDLAKAGQNARPSGKRLSNNGEDPIYESTRQGYLAVAALEHWCSWFQRMQMSSDLICGWQVKSSQWRSRFLRFDASGGGGYTRLGVGVAKIDNNQQWIVHVWGK